MTKPQTPNEFFLLIRKIKPDYTEQVKQPENSHTTQSANKKIKIKRWEYIIVQITDLEQVCI